ncbi:ATP-grasp domain-containing protein [Streptomyces sp. PKU-MA01144]|uniref:ATP-grasp domain-containing protein n=1 Tax=Streptomyces sp. PKU-MA01144 TaxID=2729138 RepID=UPI00147FFC1D|nr:ATP-grasp domain-containing protein [Streptomyces sp. PKU-MA01144]NNJ03355.1 ATP-grasp domain-containing protein [Streptomyces sp. PKU-MA01144]
METDLPGSGVADDRPLLLLVSPMGRLSRGYLLESVAKEYRLWLFTEEEPTWERELVIGHTMVDTLDADAMIEAARQVPADGVLCWDETRILPSALLAEEFGMPTMPSEAVRTCRDKHATRLALSTAGASPVAASAAEDLPQALSAAGAIGYPVVVKPRALVGSNGTTLVTGPEHLAQVFESIAGRSMREVRERFQAPVVVEEYLDGPEISVDALCWNGLVTPLFVARKHLGYAPHFEEVGHTVDSADPLLEDPELRSALTAVHAAVGLQRAWTHTEWRLTRNGPRLVEINARSGGDLIPYLGRLVTGVDAGLAAAALALGVRPPSNTRRQGAAAIRFLYPERDIVAGQVRINEALLPPAVERLDVLASPGELLRLPPRAHVTCRYAQVVVAAATAAECDEALDKAAASITLLPFDSAPETAE